MIKKKLQIIPLIIFISLVLVGIISHIVILTDIPAIDSRIIHSLSLGISYDFMIGGLFAILALPFCFFPTRIQKIIASLIGLFFFIFTFSDYHYYLQFGTHFPYSALEYVNQPGEFKSTIISVLLHPSVIYLLLGPALLFLFVIFRIKEARNTFLANLKSVLITFLLLLVFTAGFGSYSNSYVSKNFNNPLTSAGVIYFHWSKRIEPIEKIKEPKKSLELIKKLYSKKRNKKPEYSNFPLVHDRLISSCDFNQQQNKIGKSLCKMRGKPNIILLMMESFRAAEVGVYGSKMKLTPEFDKWSKKGIFFKNFYANGFQTRHGQIATYCSVMPNYGAAVMKRYSKNNFKCFPEILKKQGYNTSFVFGGDSAFDDLINFFPRIGIDRIIDQFAFPENTETLGWGYSDQAMFKRWVVEIDKLKEPFFTTALTVTNHHPFDVPEEFKFNKGDDYQHKYYESMYYTDAMLGQFLEKIQTKPWYKNTIVIVTADTSNYQLPQAPFKDTEDFIKIRSQIPFLILGGLIKEPIVVDDYASQIDIAPTLMELITDKLTTHWAGNSMLNKDYPGIAFTNRPGNYWAVMSKKGRFYYNSGKEYHVGFREEDKKKEYKELGKSWLEANKWLLQENLIWKK